jgi:hypothetical protein
MTIYRLKGASGAVINQSFTLGQHTVIGRVAACDLVVDDERVMERHAEIIQDEHGGLVLQKLDAGAELQLNGQDIERSPLSSGDEIRMGACRWVLQAPGLRPQKILTTQAVKGRRSHLPWLIITAVLAAAALAWQRGWLDFL